MQSVRGAGEIRVKPVRARFQNGGFTLLEPVDLPEGAEFVLTVEPSVSLDVWRAQVSFRCVEVEPLGARFSWFLPGPGTGAPRVRRCFILAESQPLGHVDVTPGVLQLEHRISLTPHEIPRKLEFCLHFEDQAGERHLVEVIHVRIPAVQVVLQDLADGPPAAWEVEGNWGRIDGGVWTDSPVGDYGNNADYSLTSPLISLGALEGTTLVFEERHNIEEFSDWCHLEVQCEDGPWERLSRYTGMMAWQPQCFDLSPYDGTRVRLRFRLVSDRSVTRDGFYFRNLVVAGRRAR